MVEKIISKVIEDQVESEQIKREDFKIYAYGYTLVYEVLVNMVIAIFIGVLSHKFALVTLFLGLYIPLRSYCGGWHADEFWKCTIFSNLILIMMIILDKWWLGYYRHWIAVCVFLGCGIFVLLCAPVETKTKPISYEESKLYRKKIRVIVVCEMVLFSIALFLHCRMLGFALEYVYAVQTCMLIIGMVHKINRLPDR